jgi:hypothetical protein
MYSFEQPELRSDFIIVSSPRIFIRDYAAATLYSGQQILAVATPLSGWTDVGLISNVQIPVTRNITKLQLGIPKTTRKAFEASRESQVTLTFHEMAVETIANLIGVSQKNVIPMAPIVTVTNTTNAVFTLGTSQETNRFVVGDVITFWSASSDALDVQEKVVSAVDIAAKTVTVVGVFAGTTPATSDILITKAATVASYSGVNKTITVSAGDAARFVANDRVVFLAKAGISGDNLGGLRTSTDRTYITSVDVGGAVLNLHAAFTGTPVATDILVAYRSIEMLDPLGTIAEKSLLLFFDWVINNIQRQFAIWYPKVTVAGSFSPDFKGGENFMDANITYEAQSTTQIMTDGTSSTVLSIPFQFD